MTWKLLPLQRKFEFELDQAKASLQVALRQSESVRILLRTLIDTRAEQAGVRWSAQQHAHTVAYLAEMSGRIAVADARRSALDQHISAARERCLQCQRKLELLQAVHDQARAQHLREARARAGREMDDAWLAKRHNTLCSPGGWSPG
jgi:flagellar biosynthesis chaperone FliJ